LMFGEHEKKVKEANSPINYFYKSLKAGGLTRPKGFEFPEERRARITKENTEARQKAVDELERLQQQNEKLAEQEIFNATLEDKESVEAILKEIEQKHLTPKAKQTIKIYREKALMDETLKNKLLIHFRSKE